MPNVHLSRSNQVIWFENPTWAPHTISESIPNLYLGPIYDLNNDGRLDILFGGMNLMDGTNELGWYENAESNDQWIKNTIVTDTAYYFIPLPLAIMVLDQKMAPSIVVTQLSTTTLFGDLGYYYQPKFTSSTELIDIKHHPNLFTLFQKYPNPLNPNTMINC